MKKVSDMYLVATLLAVEVPYQRIEEDGRRKQFLFDDSAYNVVVFEGGEPVIKEELSLNEIESSHASGNLLVSSDRLCAAIRNVKSLIHARS